MAMHIRPYHPDDFPALGAFLRDHWATEHAIYDRTLFDWQYRIDDARTDPALRERGSALALDGSRIVGFLGAIPGTYRVRGQSLPGAALALWVVARELRNAGLGIYLLKHIQDRNPVVVCLGVNPSVVGFYEKLGYTFLPRLRRYVVPLEAHGYTALLAHEAPADRVADWTSQVRASLGPPLAPAPISNADLARCYHEGIEPSAALSLLRDEPFWRWRYRQSAGFRYALFAQGRSAIVARVEPVHAPGTPRHGTRVLRLIEVLSAEDAPALVQGVLAWAVAQGCVAADYQCASGRFAAPLRAAGFEEQTDLSGTRGLATLLAPYRPEAAPINVVWKVPGPTPIAPEEAYLVKSDGDMDRPNHLT